MSLVLEKHADAWIVYLMHYTSYVLLPAFTGYPVILVTQMVTWTVRYVGSE